MTTPHASGDVELHYDAQANNHYSRGAALAARNAGSLIQYKKHANAVKRRMIEQYAGRKHMLIDLGCGRGGDIGKWRDARLERVVALDLSAKQLDEARMRAKDGRGGKKPSTHTSILWLHGSFLDPELRARMPPAGTADAVASQFALQYAFGSEAYASRVVGAAASMLRPGGVFFGVAPDADAILRMIDERNRSRDGGGGRDGGGSSGDTGHGTVADNGGGDGAGRARELHLCPPEHPFSLLLRLPGRAPPAEFGTELVFSLEDTVTSGSETDDAYEFLLHRDTLTRLAATHGLVPVEMASLADARARGGSGQLGASEALVASLYFTFALRKEDDAPRRDDGHRSLGSSWAEAGGERRAVEYGERKTGASPRRPRSRSRSRDRNVDDSYRSGERNVEDSYRSGERNVDDSCRSGERNVDDSHGSRDRWHNGGDRWHNGGDRGGERRWGGGDRWQRGGDRWQYGGDRGQYGGDRGQYGGDRWHYGDDGHWGGGRDGGRGGGERGGERARRFDRRYHDDHSRNGGGYGGKYGGDQHARRDWPRN